MYKMKFISRIKYMMPYATSFILEPSAVVTLCNDFINFQGLSRCYTK